LANLGAQIDADLAANSVEHGLRLQANKAQRTGNPDVRDRPSPVGRDLR
jgi:hypothetical protein